MARSSISYFSNIGDNVLKFLTNIILKQKYQEPVIGQKFKILVPIGVCKNLIRPRNFSSPQQSENSWPHDHGQKWSSAAVNYRLWSNWRDFVISSSLFFLYFEVVSVFFSHNFLHTFFCISNFLFIVAPKKCISNKYKCACLIICNSTRKYIFQNGFFFYLRRCKFLRY